MKLKKLKEVIISITDRCNLKCKMCDIPLKFEKEVLTTEQLVSLIADLKKIEVDNIVFSGGEPLLRDDIFILIKESHRQGFRTCLTTNGTLVSAAVALKLKQAGTNIVNVSLEGPCDIHDALRGAGTYVKSVEALKYLKAAGIETTIATCVSKFNYHAISSVMELAYSLGVTTVKFQGFSNLFLKSSQKQFWLAPQDSLLMEKEIDKVLSLAKRYHIYTNPEKYLKQLPLYLSGMESGPAKKGCLALWESCAIDAKGDIYPCWVINDVVIGNITRQRIVDVWGTKQHKLIRNNIVKRTCQGCLLSCYDDEYKKITAKDVLDKLIAKINIYTKHQQKLKEISLAKFKLKTELDSSIK